VAAASVLLASLVVLPDALACTCVSPGCGSVSATAHLFEATAARIETGAGGERIVHLTDVRSRRGDSAPAFVIGGNGVDCGFQFRAGVRYLIEAEPDGGRFSVSGCSQTRPLAAARGLLAFLATPATSEHRQIWGRVSADDIRGQGLGWPGGRPIGGATVTVDGPVQRRRATSEDGAFSFDDMPHGTYRVTVEVPGEQADVLSPPPQTLTLRAPATCAEVNVVAPSAARVTGIVVTPDGAPADGVFVELFPAPYNQWAGGFVHGAVSGPDGRFTIERLPPGRYVGGIGVPYPSPERAVAPVLARSLSGGAVLDIAPGMALEVAALVARPAPQIAVVGRIVAAPGTTDVERLLILQPLDGLATARTLGGRASRDGTFSIRAHRGVRYRVLVEEGTAIVGRTEFVASDAPLEIRLDPRDHQRRRR